MLSLSLTVWAQVTAGLYECRNAAESPIYTDSPAQLDRLSIGGSHSGASRLGAAGGTVASSSTTQAAEMLKRAVSVWSGDPGQPPAR